MTHDSRPSRSRKPTARRRAAEITTQGPHGGIVFRFGVDRHDEKDSGARELRDDRLRNSGWHASLHVGLICSAPFI